MLVCRAAEELLLVRHSFLPKREGGGAGEGEDPLGSRCACRALMARSGRRAEAGSCAGNWRMEVSCGLLVVVVVVVVVSWV